MFLAAFRFVTLRTEVKGFWWPYLCIAVVGSKRLSLKVESSFESLRLFNKSLEQTFVVLRFFFFFFFLAEIQLLS